MTIGRSRPTEGNKHFSLEELLGDPDSMERQAKLYTALTVLADVFSDPRDMLVALRDDLEANRKEAERLESRAKELDQRARELEQQEQSFADLDKREQRVQRDRKNLEKREAEVAEKWRRIEQITTMTEEAE